MSLNEFREEAQRSLSSNKFREEAQRTLNSGKKLRKGLYWKTLSSKV